MKTLSIVITAKPPTTPTSQSGIRPVFDIFIINPLLIVTCKTSSKIRNKD
jgi:hypothetical protein